MYDDTVLSDVLLADQFGSSLHPAGTCVMKRETSGRY